MNLFEETYPEDIQEQPKPQPTKKTRIHGTRKKVKELFNAIRERSCCVDCGWKKCPALLEFHHTVRGNTRVRGKNRRDLSISPRNVTSVVKMEAELKKGVFLCPTCHKIRHYNPKTGKVESYNKELA